MIAEHRGVNGAGPSLNGTSALTAPPHDDAPFFEERPLVDVPRLLRALRRRWRLLALACLAGMIAATVLLLVSPPPYVATTTLLLRHPATADPTRDMATDVEIVTSRTVAERAMAALRLHGSVDQFLASYTPTSLSDYVLRISAKAPGPQEALRRAGALAMAFLEYRRAQFQQQSAVTVAALDERRRRLESELAAINGDIGNALGNPVGNAPDTSADATAPPQGGDQLTEQLSRRTTISHELDDVRQQIDATMLEAGAIVQTSRIVDPPAVVDTGRSKAMAGTIAAGLVLGLALGGGPIVLREMLSDRVRRRSAVTAALGAPVVVSTGPLGGSLLDRRARLIRRPPAAPGGDADLRRIVCHLRGVLTRPDTPCSLVVVSLGSDAVTAAAVSALAHELVAQARVVLVADLSPHASVAALLQARSTGLSAASTAPGALRVACPSPQTDVTVDPPAIGADADARRDAADAVLALATVDPSRDARHLARWATVAVVLVTAGHSTASGLRSAGQLLRAAGITLDSVVLIGADPDDETVGLIDGVADSVAAEEPDRSMEHVDG